MNVHQDYFKKGDVINGTTQDGELVYGKILDMIIVKGEFVRTQHFMKLAGAFGRKKVTVQELQGCTIQRGLFSMKLPA